MTSSSEVTMSGRVRAAGVGHTEPHSHRTTSRDKCSQEETETEGQAEGRQAGPRCVCLVECVVVIVVGVVDLHTIEFS